MEPLTFAGWIIIVMFFCLLAFFALRCSLLRYLMFLITLLPLAAIITYEIFRIPVMDLGQQHKMEFYSNWSYGGHRGSVHDGIPENSLEAMTAVKNEGGQLVEMDIHVTKDGEAVIIHDDNVLNVTGVNKKVSEMTIAEFKQLRFLNTNISLPTFDDAVKHCVSLDLAMLWDIKSINEALVKKFIQQIRENNLYSKVMIAGFNPVDTYTVKKADPKILTGYTYRTWQLSTVDGDATQPRFDGLLNTVAQILDVALYGLVRSFIIPKFIGADMIFYHVNDANRFLSLEAKRNNMHFGVWTSNNHIEQQWLLKYLKAPFLTDIVKSVKT